VIMYPNLRGITNHLKFSVPGCLAAHSVRVMGCSLAHAATGWPTSLVASCSYLIPASMICRPISAEETPIEWVRWYWPAARLRRNYVTEPP